LEICCWHTGRECLLRMALTRPCEWDPLLAGPGQWDVDPCHERNRLGPQLSVHYLAQPPRFHCAPHSPFIFIRKTETMSARRPLVSAEWLAQRLSASKRGSERPITVLDCTWNLKEGAHKGRERFRSARIPGSSFFDIDSCVSGLPRHANLPHMLPSFGGFLRFAREDLRAPGFGPRSDVCVYDRSGEFVASARVWHTLKTFGHLGNVFVLDGGLLEWEDRGFDLERGEEDGGASESASAESYAAQRETTAASSQQQQAIADFLCSEKSDVDELVKQGVQIIDARPSDRFQCLVEEPRPGVRRGTIATSVNIPHHNVLKAVSRLDSETPIRTILEEDALKNVFSEAGVDWRKPGTTMVLERKCP
jgi:thiosulfate/3-mercaptopyruvate sulfurtransferase